MREFDDREVDPRAVGCDDEAGDGEPWQDAAPNSSTQKIVNSLLGPLGIQAVYGWRET